MVFLQTEKARKTKKFFSQQFEHNHFNPKKEGGVPFPHFWVTAVQATIQKSRKWLTWIFHGDEPPI